MKIKNIEMVNIAQTLDSFAEKYLPQKISYAITRNITMIGSDLQSYSKSLDKILKTYSDYVVKDEKGEVVNLPFGVPKVDDEHIDEYLKEIDELLGIEVDIDFYTIDSSIFDYESDKYDPLSAKDIMVLQKILCEPKEDVNNEKVE